MATPLRLSSDQRASFAAANDGVPVEKCPTPWLEATIVDDLGIPIAQERCVLHVDSERIGPIATNSAGVVCFAKIPDGSRHHVQLIDILEAWSSTEKTADWLPKPDNYRRHDGTAHPVRPCVVADQQRIIVDHLSESEKLAHFHDAYIDNNAYYTSSFPRDFSQKHLYWDWSKGSVCNQHVNFFLGYWFNYNAKFTTAASALFMDATTMMDSGMHELDRIKYRGFSEFVEPVATDDFIFPHPKIDRKIHYLRICNASFGGRTAKECTLYAQLDDINVYSLSDIPWKRQPAALAAVRAWLGQHPDRLPADTKLTAMTTAKLWHAVWMLDANNPEDTVLLHKLQRFLNVDHHAGVLFKRGDDLYTFSADGSPTNRLPIVIRHFATNDVSERKFLHLGLWKTKRLRPGGYIPQDTANNAGGIAIHTLSRFIHWNR